MRPRPASPPKRLLQVAAVLLAVCCTSPLFAEEPDSYRLLKKLVTDDAGEAAVGQARLYLEQFPKGEHRDQVTAWLGEMLAGRGEAEAAVALLTSPLPKLPPKERAKVNLALGRAYLDLKQPERARTALSQPPLPDKADIPQWNRLLGRAAFDLGQFEEAARALRKVPAAGRTREDSLCLARALVNGGEDRGGSVELVALLEGETLPAEEEASLRLSLAGCLYRLGDFESVGAVVSPLAGDGERRGEALLLQAWALHRLGRAAEAYDLARKASPLKGWEEGLLLAPLRSARLALDIPALETACRLFLKRYPDSEWASEAHLGLALCAEAQGDAHGALAALEQALPHLSASAKGYETALAAGRLAVEALRDWPRAKRHFGLAVEAAPDKTSRARALLSLARAGSSLGATSEGLAALTRLVKEFPHSSSVPGAYLLLGQLRAAEGDRAQGQEAFQVVIEEFPDSPEYPSAVLASAETLRAQGESALALERLRPLAGLPLPAEIASRRDRLLAALSLAVGDLTTAEATLLQITETAPDREAEESARFHMGLLRLAQGNTDAAAATFGALRDPRLAAAGRFRLALASFRSDQVPEGATLLETLSAPDCEERATALWALSEAWTKVDQPEEAAAALRRLAEAEGADPLSALAQRRVEMVLLAQEGPAAALAEIPAFRHAEPVSPTLVADLLKSARLALASGATEKADKAFRAYLDLAPQGAGAAEASLGLARSAMRRGEWAEARSLLSGVPESAARDSLLGEACYALREMAAAQAAYERALASQDGKGLSPQGALEARYFAGMAAAIQGDHEAALAHWDPYAREGQVTLANRERLLEVALWLQRNRKLEPALAALERLKKGWRDAAVAFQFAYTLELLERREEALAAFLAVGRSFSNAQWVVTARYRAAELMVQLGRTEEALSLYRDLAAATEGSVQGDFAKERLRALEAAEPTAPPQETPDAPAPAPR